MVAASAPAAVAAAAPAPSARASAATATPNRTVKATMPEATSRSERTNAMSSAWTSSPLAG